MTQTSRLKQSLQQRMSKLKLHLDADVSIKALHSALLNRGHDVTRTPNGWMPEDASDEFQLITATEQGRCILTYNVKDFIALASKFPQHQGILLATQRDCFFSDLIRSLERVLTETHSKDWKDHVGWLSQWR